MRTLEKASITGRSRLRVSPLMTKGWTEAEQPIQLLRLELPGGSTLFPEVSGSHYRCSVRFLEWHGVSKRPAQAQDDVSFILTCCS